MMAECYSTQIEADAVKLLLDMTRIRLVEEAIVSRYGGVGEYQPMRCPVHLSIGQESAAVGACASLLPEDKVFSGHRCHAHYLAKGGSLRKMVFELYGKKGGCLDGRGGSMHLMDKDAGVILSIPILGSSIPLAVGSALSDKLNGQNRVTFAFFGDAATEEGVFHESLNYASLHSLPIVFVCENNDLSIYTKLSERQPSRPLTELGRAHGLNSFELSDKNVFELAHSFQKITQSARKENRPSFVVINTDRWLQHCGISNDDHLGYRDELISKSDFKIDPIQMAFTKLLEHGSIAREQYEEFRESCLVEIEDVFSEADKAPLPEISMASNYVYAD